MTIKIAMRPPARLKFIIPAIRAGEESKRACHAGSRRAYCNLNIQL